MLWHELSWPQLQQTDKNIPVVIPLGACEQHGPHLPILSDIVKVDVITERINHILGEQVIILPTLWLGSSHHHKDFPGTISVLPSMYSQITKQIATSILQAGFRRLYFIIGHGGNRVPTSQALTELVCQSDQADNAYLTMGSDADLAGAVHDAERVGGAEARGVPAGVDHGPRGA